MGIELYVVGVEWKRLHVIRSLTKPADTLHIASGSPLHAFPIISILSA